MDGWIQTFTGRKVEPLDPDPAAIAVEDIAHALSLHCRFNGHYRVFYSVAEHSVRVSRQLNGDAALWGLLHDASEAYLSDVPKPLKPNLPDYCAVEDRLMRVIARRFGLSWPIPDAVHAADATLLATERRDLMAEARHDWGLHASPLDATIQPLSFAEAEQAFLARFAELRA